MTHGAKNLDIICPFITCNLVENTFHFHKKIKIQIIFFVVRNDFGVCFACMTILCAEFHLASVCYIIHPRSQFLTS